MTQQLPDWLEAIAGEGAQADRDAANRFGGAWSMNAAQKFGLANLLAQHRRAALAKAAPLIVERMAQIADAYAAERNEDGVIVHQYLCIVAAEDIANAIRREVNRDE